MSRTPETAATAETAGSTDTEGRYVALGSSMAAGPGLRPRGEGPRAAGRSRSNYPHLVAAARRLELVDVSSSGATTRHVLGERHFGEPPQLEALTGEEVLVTVTIGGNDIGYVPGMMLAALDRTLLGLPHRLPRVGRELRDLLDPDRRDEELARLGAGLRGIGRAVRERSPGARVLFVDYLTLLPRHGRPAPPLGSVHADLARHLAARLEEATADAAAATGCEHVRVGESSREHHAWSDDPWTSRAALPLPGRPLMFHPTVSGMRAVADLVVAHLDATTHEVAGEPAPSLRSPSRARSRA